MRDTHAFRNILFLIQSTDVEQPCMYYRSPQHQVSTDVPVTSTRSDAYYFELIPKLINEGTIKIIRQHMRGQKMDKRSVISGIKESVMNYIKQEYGFTANLYAFQHICRSEKERARPVGQPFNIWHVDVKRDIDHDTLYGLLQFYDHYQSDTKPERDHIPIEDYSIFTVWILLTQDPPSILSCAGNLNVEFRDVTGNATRQNVVNVTEAFYKEMQPGDAIIFDSQRTPHASLETQKTGEPRESIEIRFIMTPKASFTDTIMNDFQYMVPVPIMVPNNSSDLYSDPYDYDVVDMSGTDSDNDASMGGSSQYSSTDSD